MSRAPIETIRVSLLGLREPLHELRYRAARCRRRRQHVNALVAIGYSRIRAEKVVRDDCRIRAALHMRPL